VNNRFGRLYSLSLLLLLAVSVIMYQFTKTHLRENLESDLKLSSNSLISQLSKQIELAFSDITSDLIFLSSDNHLRELYSNPDRGHTINALQEIWTGFATHRQRYDQIRFINASGTEAVRINYNKGAPAPVPENKLQSKRHRYYFTDVIDLPPGTVYVSPLDLNIENKRIELPLKPMIRFGTPVADESGQTIGVMLLNYTAESLLNDFILAASGFQGQAMLVNNEGYPLVSPHSDQAWSFMFPDSPQTNIRTQHRSIWTELNTETRGQLLTPEGLYTFDHIDPSGSGAKLGCTSCLTILLFTPEAQIASMLKRQMHAILPPFAFSLILLAIILGLLLWHWDRRRIQKEEISQLNDQIVFERDLFVSGPVAIIKMRNEIGWPVEYCSSNLQELLGYKTEAFLNASKTFASIIDPDYLPQYIRENQEADNSGALSFKRSSYPIIDQEGNRKWVQDLCSTIRDPYGNVTHYYAHISDITPLKEAENNLTLSRDYIQKVVDTIPDPTMVIDVSNYQLQLTNQSARSLYNGGREISPQMTCYRLSHKRDAPCTGMTEPCPIHEVLLTGKAVSVRHKHYNHRGKLLYIDVRSTPLFDPTGKSIVQIVESHRDVTSTVIMEKELQHLANTDRLTQVYNRLKFDDELKSQIEWARSTRNALGLIMFDLDHFKQVNDTFGHDIGDLVLRNTVELVQMHIRKSDTLARWGGEEFMIITPLTDCLELKTIAESLRSKIEEQTHERAGQVTASFGGSILRAEDSFTNLIKRVDAALYQSKQQGRNRCTIIE
jgi:diguanylate cyclase (GGDEF)-like protein/PAS domain S-box-containing protein